MPKRGKSSEPFALKHLDKRAGSAVSLLRIWRWSPSTFSGRLPARKPPAAAVLRTGTRGNIYADVATRIFYKASIEISPEPLNISDASLARSVPTSSKRRGGWIAPGVLLTAFLVCLFGWSMDRGLNHDEHQFLVPGALLANEGLLPFRDYPIFHLPNLTFIYAALDWLTQRPIFSAKLFSVCCSWVLGLLLVVTAYKYPPFRQRHHAFPAACLALGFLFFDPLFAYTSGKTWNHEFPTCLAIAATLLVIKNFGRASVKLSTLAGLCLGCAIGTRLTFAPLLIPITIAPLFTETTLHRRILLALTCGAGAFAGLLPALLLYGAAPEAFLFDNFQFPRLRLLDPTNERIQKTMAWWRKLRYLAKEIALPSWPLFAAFLLFGIRPGLQAFRDRKKGSVSSAVVLFTIPFVIAGCFAPSRYQQQHYFVLIPFLVLGVLLGVAATPMKRPAQMVLPALFVASFIAYCLGQTRKGNSAFEWVPQTFQPAEWFPNRAHVMSMELRKHVGAGKVLTLAPAWPAEAGLQIYPEFANGPFAWRAAHLVEPERRKRLKLVAPADLEEFLSHDAPAALLLGVEDEELEAPLRQYAIDHGYRKIKPTRKWELWLTQESEALRAASR